MFFTSSGDGKIGRLPKNGRPWQPFVFGQKNGFPTKYMVWWGHVQLYIDITPRFNIFFIFLTCFLPLYSLIFSAEGFFFRKVFGEFAIKFIFFGISLQFFPGTKM